MIKIIKSLKDLKISLLLVFILIFATSAMVDTQTKVAHIASQELVEAMPEFIAAKREIEKLNKTYETEIKAMVLEYQNTIKKFTQEAEQKTKEENIKRQSELQATEQSINSYRENAARDLQTKQTDLLKPITEKARVAIQKVARSKGFNYVFDSTLGTGMIMADGMDLMSDVKKELGI
ncbi:OmpH family outer membrane protein [uncultured Aquimarina sp.]|uniref:OmpH family outer membrane protein n=1 Tax=uncultured Aquimarina sp. TaxID=575652 RepID=UPI00260BB0BA|nr:OmpH family outer membrane protein [uncultured Aquimarina sp.]